MRIYAVYRSGTDSLGRPFATAERQAAMAHDRRTVPRWLTVLAGCSLAAFLVCTLVGCSLLRREPAPEDVEELGQLAYDENPGLGYTVYVDEAGEPVPYLVLTNDYNGGGGTLLLRKYIMDETRRYNSMYRGAAYYAESEIDAWLESEFLAMLAGIDPVESVINISSKEALGPCGDETEDISRRAFLLSWGEVGASKSRTIPDSGTVLAYFDDDPKRLRSCMAGARPSAWGLRSVDTCNDSRSCGVAPNGKSGGGGVDYANGVRPAFCLDPSTGVELTENRRSEEVFVIKS